MVESYLVHHAEGTRADLLLEVELAVVDLTEGVVPLFGHLSRLFLDSVHLGLVDPLLLGLIRGLAFLGRLLPVLSAVLPWLSRGRLSRSFERLRIDVVLGFLGLGGQ